MRGEEEVQECKRPTHRLSDTERMYNERINVRANIKYVGVSIHIQHK